MLWEHIQVCSESLPRCVRVTHEKVCIYTHLYVCCFENKKKVCCSNTSYLRVHLCISGHLLELWCSSSIWVAFFTCAESIFPLYFPSNSLCYQVRYRLWIKNSFFRTRKQSFAIHFFLATCKVCPVAIPEIFAKAQGSRKSN